MGGANEEELLFQQCVGTAGDMTHVESGGVGHARTAGQHSLLAQATNTKPLGA